MATKRILIVDDHRDTAQMMRMVLKGHGYDVGIGRREAIASATATHPAVILMDLTLPVMSGLETAWPSARPGDRGHDDRRDLGLRRRPDPRPLPVRRPLHQAGRPRASSSSWPTRPVISPRERERGGRKTEPRKTRSDTEIRIKI